MSTLSTTARPGAPLRGRQLPWRISRFTWIAVAVAVVGRLLFVARPASPDEGGYLLVASQWHAGSSLYGDYWLARPPLLVGIAELADALGGTIGLRVVGVLAVVACVLLAAAIRREVTAPVEGTPATLSHVAPVALVAIFMTTPLFGNTHVDGELLAAPFVLCGVLAYLRASTATDRSRTLGWSLAAGAAATSAAMVKQNSIDVFVFVAACVVVRLLAGDRRAALRGAAVFATGAFGAAVVIVGIAMLRGTSLASLWDAVVSFRAQAPSVLDSGGTDANSVRLQHLVLAALGSLAPVVIGALAWQSRGRVATTHDRRRTPLDLRWPAYALLAWEVVSIAGGGSFWLHYLLDLVPGIAVLAVAAAQRPPTSRRVLGGVLAATALSAGIATSADAVAGPDYASDAGAIAYLRDHARPGDTATVAFGQPNILWDAHLSSPYEQLWSLPVRVRDSDLTTFSHLLESPEAPTWIVVEGNSLYSWGLDAGRADQVLGTRYQRVANEGPYVIWHLDPRTAMS